MSQLRSQSPIRAIVSSLTGKKNMKNVVPVLESVMKAQDPLWQYSLLTALFEAVDWKDTLENGNSKDQTRARLLAKTLKMLSTQPGFVDHFGSCLTDCSNRTIIYSRFKEILACLKLFHPTDLIMSTSLAMNCLDDEQQHAGLQLLRDHLSDISDQGKLAPLPAHFSLALVQFLKINEEQFRDVRDSIRFFLEASLGSIKDPRLASLFARGEPEVSLPDLSKEIPSVDFQKLGRAGNDFALVIKELLLHQDSPGGLAAVLKEFPGLTELEVLRCLVALISSAAESEPSASSPTLPVRPAVRSPAVEIAFVTLHLADTGTLPADGRVEVTERAQPLSPEQLLVGLAEAGVSGVSPCGVLRCLAVLDGFELSTPSSERRFFFQLLNLFAFSKRQSGSEPAADLIEARWADQQLQFQFLMFILENPDSAPTSLLDRGRLLGVENASGVVIGRLQEMPPAWLNKELLARALELGPQVHGTERLRSWFESGMLQNFEGVFFVLLSIETRGHCRLFNDLMRVAVALMLNSMSSVADLVEAALRLRRRAFLQALSELGEGEGGFIVISKALDWFQPIHEFFASMTPADPASFSVPLGLLAVKREFLRLEHWLTSRVTALGVGWVEELLRYLHSAVLEPMAGLKQPTKRQVDELLDKAILSTNSLAVLFETLQGVTPMPARHKQQAEAIYRRVLAIVPELEQVTTSDTEQRANEMLEALYAGRTTIDEFMERVGQLKQSASNRDQEILSCLILNIIDEFRFYPNFPERELYITSEIFGRFIRERVVDGKALVILLKALTDSLEKDGKMFNFGLKAVQHFLLTSDHIFSAEFYKSLFMNERLREQQPKMLLDLQTCLTAANRMPDIPSELVEALARRSPTAREEGEPGARRRLRAEQQEVKGAGELNLVRLLNRTFSELEAEDQLSESMREKIVFLLNSIDEKKLEKRMPEFEELMKERPHLSWFSKYVVFKLVPYQTGVQGLYRKIIYRASVKNLYKTVYTLTMRMINLVMDYMISRENLVGDDKKTSVSCGKWVGQMTLVCNKPIVTRDLDIKAHIMASLEQRSVANIIPVVCAILSMVDRSMLFKVKVPFVNALFDFLREVRQLPSVQQGTKIFIEVLFNASKVNEADLHRFNFYSNRRGPELEKNSFVIASLPSYVKLDFGGLNEAELLGKLHVDLKQIVAAAIDNSIKGIIKPVLDRSVKNTLETTRELALKDFAFEEDERKLFESAKAMITNLTWNLALVTCKEPLRIEITEHLNHLFSIQTDLLDEERRVLKEALASANLDLACSIVKKIVIENSIGEISKDKAINDEMEMRRNAREAKKRYVSEFHWAIMKELPEALHPTEAASDLEGIEIYTKHYQTNNGLGRAYSLGATGASEPELPPTRNAEESRVLELVRQLEKEVENPVAEERMKAILGIYTALGKNFQAGKVTETQAVSLTEHVLKALFHNQVSKDKLRHFSDVLVIYCSSFPRLASHITRWVFSLDEARAHKPQIFIIFLRRSLVVLKEFDELFAQQLTDKALTALNSVIIILKNVVVEEKIFSIFSFPQIVARLIVLSRAEIMHALCLENAIFVEALAEFVASENPQTELQLKMANIEPEYRRLLIDVREYFQVLAPDVFDVAAQSLAAILAAEDEDALWAIVGRFDEHLKDDKGFTTFFCYLFDMAVNKALARSPEAQRLQGDLPIDYSYVDGLSQFVSVLLKRFERSSHYFEKILISLIMVLTKHHSFGGGRQFNQKPFHKLLFNLLIDLNREEFRAKEQQSHFKIIVVQTLHILQPIKYPGFACAWLQLVGSPFLLAILLKDTTPEVWSHYTILLLDLVAFLRHARVPGQPISEELRVVHRSTARLFLLLLHDFPDFLCDQSFALLEEIPQEFMQFRNIVQSAYPRSMKIPNPFDVSNQNYQNAPEFRSLPTVSQKVESRVSSHSLSAHLGGFTKTKEQSDFDAIVSALYVTHWNGQQQLNQPLLESFVLFVPSFIYSSELTRLPERAEPVSIQELQ
jgi:hypothetical protein